MIVIFLNISSEVVLEVCAIFTLIAAVLSIPLLNRYFDDRKNNKSQRDLISKNEYKNSSKLNLVTQSPTVQTDTITLITFRNTGLKADHLSIAVPFIDKTI